MRLQLRPSRALAAMIVAAHAAAGGAVAFLMTGWLGAALGAALLALGIAAAWNRALLRGKDAVRVLDVSRGGAACELGSGERIPVAPARRRYVSRRLVTLPLAAGASRWYVARTLLVTADMLSANDFRRLRVWALWGRVAGVAGEQLAA